MGIVVCARLFGMRPLVRCRSMVSSRQFLWLLLFLFGAIIIILCWCTHFHSTLSSLGHIESKLLISVTKFLVERNLSLSPRDSRNAGRILLPLAAIRAFYLNLSLIRELLYRSVCVKVWTPFYSLSAFRDHVTSFWTASLPDFCRWFFKRS